MESRSDSQLIADYLAGDEKSLEILFGRYLKLIYSFVYRYTGGASEAEDITQDVFVKAWRGLKKFDQEKSFKTWLFSIAKNTSIDFFKHKKTISFSQFSAQGGSASGGENENGQNMFEDTLIDPAPLPQELFEKAELAQMLNLAMEKLSPKYRMVLFLRYNDHFNFREISESLEESIDTIKSRHRRALIQLKQILMK